MAELELMTPEHPLWEEFISRLEGPEGCDFKDDENGDIVWKCAGGMDQTYAEKILKTMKNIDVESSLQFMRDNGGHCDCEIIFNVDPDV